MSPGAPPAILALSPGDLAPLGVERFVNAVARAVAAGLRGVVLREPGMEDGVTLALAQQLARVLEPHAGWLCVHDRVHLVAAAGAQATHLGFRSLPVDAAREALGSDCAIGVSVHAGDPPERWAGADHVFFGPVLDTPSKRGLVEPVGFDRLARFTSETETPVWAIGGLLPEHVATVREAGARGLAVRAGLLGAEDPASAARAYLEAWEA